MSEDEPGPDPDPDPSAESSPEPSEPAEPVEPVPSSPGSVAGPAAQVITVAVAVLALIVVALVFLLQDGSKKAGPVTGSSGSSGVPEAPPSDFTPSPNPSAVLPEPPVYPTALCADITLGRPLTVLSFNIHGGEPRSGGQALGRIAEEINTWEPDVVLLQEVDDHRRRSGNVRQAEVLGELTDMSWVYGGNQQVRDGGPIGNAILSRYEIEDSANLLLPRADGKEQRGLLHAVINVDGTRISVYSTHFDHHSGRARLKQARTAAATIAKDARPKIFGGDLNAGPGSDVLATLYGAGLGDAWSVGEGSGNTVPAGAPRSRIDYVLHDGWFQPLQAVVLASAVSDHLAVWTRVELRRDVDCIKVGA